MGSENAALVSLSNTEHRRNVMSKELAARQMTDSGPTESSASLASGPRVDDHGLTGPGDSRSRSRSASHRKRSRSGCGRRRRRSCTVTFSEPKRRRRRSDPCAPKPRRCEDQPSGLAAPANGKSESDGSARKTEPRGDASSTRMVAKTPRIRNR